MTSKKIRVVVEGHDYHLPIEMTLAAAAALTRDHLGLPKEVPFVLRRSDGTNVGEANPIGDVLQDGDELELEGEWPVIFRSGGPDGVLRELPVTVRATSRQLSTRINQVTSDAATRDAWRQKFGEDAPPDLSANYPPRD